MSYILPETLQELLCVHTSVILCVCEHWLCVYLLCVCVSVCTCVQSRVGMGRKKYISFSWHVNPNAIKSFKSFPYFFSVKHFFASSSPPPLHQHNGLREFFYRRSFFLCTKSKASKKKVEAAKAWKTWSELGTCCGPSLKRFSTLERSRMWRGKKKEKNLCVYKNIHLRYLNPFISILNCPQKGQQGRKMERDRTCHQYILPFPSTTSI